MSDKDTLVALAERCETATGPDRALDLAIGRLVNAPTGYDLPFFTASIDAALTLVPEGWRVARYADEGFRHSAALSAIDGNKPLAGSYASTPALAICAAALRARAKEQGK